MWCWEENFTDERCTLTKDGVKVGHVEPVGGSWRVVYGDDIVAFRPDKAACE